MKDKEGIALYLRLSLSDGDLGKDNKDESNSIENQRLLLQTYVEEHPELTGTLLEYVDDGYTGTNFNRPGFTSMIEDAQKGLIQTILVKDLSRLGREYIGVGDYIEQIFPVLGIRFIAVNNNFDSAAYSGTTMGLDMAVSNLINNLYSRDISKKIRSSMEVKWKQGCATASMVPYGYRWNKGVEGRWELDPEAAKYIRRIFDLALQGLGTSQITARLNEEHIPTAAMYNKRKGRSMWGQKKFKAPDEEQLWTPGKVWRVLTKYEYTGALVMGKRKAIILGSKTTRSIPKSQQVITENAHPAIVTHEEFEQAQNAIRYMAPMSYKSPNEYPLKGKVVCGNCKLRLFYTERVGGGVLYCNHKRQIGKHSNCCSDNYSEAMLNARVGYAIKKMLQFVNYLDAELAPSMTVEMPDTEKLEQEMEVLKAERVRQYEGYADGVISREQYIKKKGELSEQIAKVQKELDMAADLLAEEEANVGMLSEMTARGQEIYKPGGLTQEMVDAFVEQVYVYDSRKIEVVFQREDVIRAALDLYEKGKEAETE